MKRSTRAAIWVVVLIAAGIVAYGLGIVLHRTPLSGQALQDAPAVGDLQLVDGAGDPVTLSQYQGDVLLVYFGYTRCADTCPLTMQKLAKAYHDAGTPADVKVLMVSVDPSYDTPSVVGPWVERFDPSFIGLTGSKAQIAAAAKAFMVGYNPDAEPTDHTAVVEVVDRHSRIRYIYGQGTIVKLGDDLPRLLADRSL
ncbi:MAG TPA: SCO family protein [Trueperaceae bacterium]|nr:SCO family protein [Trueperaceae bacterium]